MQLSQTVFNKKGNNWKYNYQFSWSSSCDTSWSLNIENHENVEIWFWWVRTFLLLYFFVFCFLFVPITKTNTQDLAKNTDTALPLCNIVELLTVPNVPFGCSQIYSCIAQWCFARTLQPFFQYASNVHSYNTRYGVKQNLHKSWVKTNAGKQMISFMAIDLWQELPYNFKDLNQFAFSKSVKNHILSQQYQT